MDSAAKRRSNLLYRYGITHEQYDALFVAQQGCCAICRSVPDKPLFVDHSHESGAVRGLLCHNCNVLLGHARDDEGVLFAAIRYLGSSDG